MPRDTPRRRLRVQLALDVTSIQTAVAIAAETLDYIDRIEVGTPLLRCEGARAITTLRVRFPSVPLIADCKIMDCGAQETSMSLDAGADGVVVQALAPLETIKAVCAVAAPRNAQVLVDGIGTHDAALLAARVAGLPVDYVIAHRGKDEQAVLGAPPGMTLRTAAAQPGMPPLAVAGGLSPSNIADSAREPNVAIVIIGEAIVKSGSPRHAAAAIRRICDQERAVA